MVIITSEGIFIETIDGEDVVTEGLKDLPLSLFMDDLVHLELGTTVGDILSALQDYQDEVDITFAPILGHVNFSDVLSELAVPSDRHENFVFAEISHAASIVDGVWGEGSGLFAIGYSPRTEQLASFSLEYAPLCSYKDLEVHLNNTFQILDIDGTVLLESHRDFSLYEVISTILFELCCHGTPVERNLAFEDFIADIQTLELPPHEEAEDRVEDMEEELKKAVAAEEYEQASVIRDRLDQARNKRKK